MSKMVSGEGQVPKTRKTGRKHKAEAEAAEKYEQEKRQRELNEKYDKWGKGWARFIFSSLSNFVLH